ncbi:MAG: hypothetical protein ABR958_01390 [Dehalococcoidales bacterium]
MNKNERTTGMINKIIRLRNNVVMVFDEQGEQLPEYQGLYGDVREKILANAPAGAVFNHWFGHTTKPDIVPNERW